MPMLDPAAQQEAIAMMQGQQTNNGPGAMMEEEPMGGPEAMGAGMPPEQPGTAPMSDQIPTEGLAAMVGGDQGAPGGQDPEVAQVIAALQDPNTPPETRANIEAMLAMAARRQMAGI